MQTVETLNEGLKRAYTLTIPAAEIAGMVDAEVKRMAPQVRMPGFRPGKVPANLIRKMHGEALAQDALNSSIQQGVQTLMAEHRIRPATQPEVQLAESYSPGHDAQVTVALEVLPEVPTPSIDGLTLERLTVPVDEAGVESRLMELAGQNKSWDDAPEGHAAQMGDLVVMDFAGKVDGVAFDGGTGTDMQVELGSGRLIPGFEDGLVGATVGEERSLNVTFPEDYQVATLKGKPAVFDVSVTAVKTAAEARVDDSLAKNLGLESLDQLRGILKGQAEQELNGLTRTHMKRKLLDQLAAGHDFPVPPTMVEQEFQQIWHQLQHEAEHEDDVEKAKAELDAEKDDYRRIAERRVRLGLLLSEIGQANGIEVSQQEMNMLMQQAAQQYRPEDRQRFAEYIQNEPMAAAQLRAPLYEDKVVDFLFDKATITDREVTREALEAAIESDDGFASGTHTHDHDDPKPRKTKKAAAPAAEGDATAAPKKPAKKAKAVAEGSVSEVIEGSELAVEEPVKKASTRKTPAKKAVAAESPASDTALAEEPVKKAPTRKASAKKADA